MCTRTWKQRVMDKKIREDVGDAESKKNRYPVETAWTSAAKICEGLGRRNDGFVSKRPPRSRSLKIAWMEIVRKDMKGTQ